MFGLGPQQAAAGQQADDNCGLCACYFSRTLLQYLIGFSCQWGVNNSGTTVFLLRHSSRRNRRNGRCYPAHPATQDGEPMSVLSMVLPATQRCVIKRSPEDSNLSHKAGCFQFAQCMQLFFRSQFHQQYGIVSLEKLHIMLSSTNSHQLCDRFCGPGCDLCQPGSPYRSSDFHQGRD